MIPRLIIKVWQVRMDKHLAKFKTGKSYNTRVIIQAHVCPKAIIHKIIGNLQDQIIIQSGVVLKGGKVGVRKINIEIKSQMVQDLQLRITEILA
jgi:hypothetical protein